MSQPRIDLALVLHNHQPAGNFASVLEENHRLAYEPMLGALERHRAVHVGLHYTGPLLAWLSAERPATVELIRRLVARRQVEVLGGGLYEPVLASLPDRDRQAQLVRMADEVERLFGERPIGAWLAERVWEPDLPSTLAGAGYAYTVLDDAHLRAAGIPDERHWGPYSTDDRGRRLTILGTEQGLRYRIPFKPVEDVIAHLRRHATPDGDRLGVMGDDGEKFGAWPGTWELCWGREAWVERFFTALEDEAGWLRTLRPMDALAAHPPLGRAYVPTGSYAEMGEWALPVEARREYTALQRTAAAEGRAEARWMRGGFWRNFQVNYREINDLHKQMLRASDRVATVVRTLGPRDPRVARVVDHLHQGQSNDCYWHGLFGGIYLAHMRLATLSHLIAAHDGAERLLGAAAQPGHRVEPVDTDLDGSEELIVSGAGQQVRIRPRDGGGIEAWDIRPARHALLSVMRRREEAYHDTLRAMGSDHAGVAAQGAVSIGELVVATEADLGARLWYDAYERRSGLVHVLPTGTAPEAFERAEHEELGDLVDGDWALVEAGDRIVLERRGGVIVGSSHVPIGARKAIAASGSRREPVIEMSLEVANLGDDALDALLGVEWSLNLLGGGGNPAAWYEVDGSRGRFDAARTSRPVAKVAMGNDALGLRLDAMSSPPAMAWWSSIDTVSVSEQGFERNHQGGCLLWVWPLLLEPGASMSVELRMGVVASVDRAEEEGL